MSDERYNKPMNIILMQISVTNKDESRLISH